ncbi:MAG: GAF domain-containing protein [Bacteroidota bacterium]
MKSKESNASKNDKQESSLQESLHKFQSIKSSDFESEKEMYEKLLYFICNQVNASIGALYQTIEENKIKYQKFVTGYAFYVPESEVKKFEFGEGLVGQAAKSGKELIITDSIPEGYIKVSSGLGESDPKNLIIVPIKKDENVKGVLEIASFSKLDQDQINFLQSAAEILESSELAGKSEDKETTVEV